MRFNGRKHSLTKYFTGVKMKIGKIYAALENKPFFRYVKKVVTKIIDTDFPGMAAEMAFMFILGIFPFLLFLMTGFGKLGKSSLFYSILVFIKRVAPHDVSNLIVHTLEEIIAVKQGGIMAVILFIITIALASNAVAVIMKGLNRAFMTPETRPFWYTRFLSVIMVFVSSSVLFVATNLIVLGRILLNFVSQFIHISGFTYASIMILRWPAAFAVLFVNAFLCYFILPDLKTDVKTAIASSIPGTLFFCVFWLAGSWAFSLYLSNLNTYNRVFGTLGAFAILMVWLYYTSIIILLGGEVNSQVYEKLSQEQNEQK